MPKSRSPGVLIFMVLSSRDRKFVSVEIVWLGQSPGHRRLRFSFQFNDVKDPTGSRRPHCFAPVVGGGGYLLAGLFGVNRSFQTFAPHPDRSGKRRKNHTGPPRGNPHTVGSDSIEARENIHSQEKSKGLVGPFQTPWDWPRPSGRRYLGGPLAPVNHRLSAERNSPLRGLVLHTPEGLV
jgi:hypothetical protein